MNGNWTRTLGVAWAAVLVASTLGCGSGGEKKDGGGAVVAAKTPQEVFDTAKGAVAKDDWGTFMQCLTADSQDEMVAGMAVAGMMMPAFASLGGDEGKAAAKKITDAMEKHGMSEAAMNKLMDDKDAEKMDEKAKMKKLAGMVKDRGAFVGDMFAAMKAMGKDKEDNKILDPDAKLEDVKIDGDSATGTIVHKAKGEEKRDPATFKKIDGNWKMEAPQGKKGKTPE